MIRLSIDEEKIQEGACSITVCGKEIEVEKKVPTPEAEICKATQLAIE